MASYEALYGRLYRSPLCWAETGEQKPLGSDFVYYTSEKVSTIRRRLLTAQSRQKKYVNRRCTSLQFREGSYVFLRVDSRKGFRTIHNWEVGTKVCMTLQDTKANWSCSK